MCVGNALPARGQVSPVTPVCVGRLACAVTVVATELVCDEWNGIQEKLAIERARHARVRRLAAPRVCGTSAGVWVDAYVWMGMDESRQPHVARELVGDGLALLLRAEVARTPTCRQKGLGLGLGA